MAFAFFRKHQKIVMITMIVLMVVFLIPTAFQQMDRGGKNPTIGTSNVGKITLNDLSQARLDLQILENTELGRAGVRRQWRIPPAPTDFQFLLVQGSPDPALSYALLLREAKNQGLKVSNQELQDFKDLFFQPGAFPEFVRGMKDANKGMSESRVDEAFRDWVLINTASSLAAYDVPPSDAELKKVFRDVFERIDLRVATLSAEEIAKTIKDNPAEDRIIAQFTEFRSVLPGTFKDAFSYGFGYKQPAQAAVSYLYVSQKALEQSVMPTQEDIDQYYRDNRESKISIPVSQPATATASAPTTTQGSQPATATATAPVEEKEVVLSSLSPDKARPYIVNLLRPAMVERKMDELLGKVDQIEPTITDVKAPQTVYEAVIAKMIHPATDKLSTKIKLPITAMPVDQAIELLAEETGLTKIAFPVGKVGDKTLYPATKVTVDKGVTLEQALDQIVRQLDWIKIDKWVYLDGLENVLLPIPVDKQYSAIFPLSARQTPPMTFEEMTKDDLLGKCATAVQRGTPLALLAFSELYPQASRQVLHVGEKGPRMFVLGDNTGKLIFRLTLAEAAKDLPPTAINTDAKLREKVINDLKVVDAMKQAEDKAKTIAQAADKEGLEKAAQAAGFKAIDTDMFARKSFQSMQFSDIPKLDIPVNPAGLREFVINKAFSLAPKQIEPTTQGYGTSEAVFFRVPAKKEVLVMQRTDFRPAVQSEYQVIRGYLAEMLKNARQENSIAMWFYAANIQRRLDYKPEK